MYKTLFKRESPTVECFKKQIDSLGEELDIVLATSTGTGLTTFIQDGCNTEMSRYTVPYYTKLVQLTVLLVYMIGSCSDIQVSVNQLRKWAKQFDKYGVTYDNWFERFIVGETLDVS